MLPPLMLDYYITLYTNLRRPVSKCVIVIKRQLCNFSALSWQEQVSFQWDDDEVCLVLDQHAEMDFYSVSSFKQVCG
jgi:hypothetical protein